jgi:hypothetical protein
LACSLTATTATSAAVSKPEWNHRLNQSSKTKTSRKAGLHMGSGLSV